MDVEKIAVPQNYSIYTSLAIAKLKTGKPGDAITRDEMTQIVGRNCGPDGSGYSSVNSAIRYCEREHGIVWRWQKDQKAWVCLDDEGKVAAATGCKRRASRAIRRSMIVSQAVNPANLSEDSRRDHALNVALIGTMQIVSSPGFRKRFEEIGQPKLPDPAKVVELMKS